MPNGMTYDEAKRLTKLETIVCNELPHMAEDIADLKKWLRALALALFLVAVASGVNVAEIVRGWLAA